MGYMRSGLEEWGEWEWEMVANNTNCILPDSIDIRIRRVYLRHGVQLLSSVVAASLAQDWTRIKRHSISDMTGFEPSSASYEGTAELRLDASLHVCCRWGYTKCKS